MIAKSEAITILLIEDNPEDALLVKEYLNDSKKFRLDTVSRLTDALEHLKTKTFDIILLDLNLPDGMGLENLIKLRRYSQHIPIVVLTGVDEESIGIMAVQRGAQDYLIKGADHTRLTRSIKYAIERMRLRGIQDFSKSEEISKEEIYIIDGSERKHKPSKDLTERELQVLRLLAEGCTNQKIAEHLCISHTTVKSHISQILQKLDVKGRTAAVMEGLRQGLI
jgi:DNA-binding NarL/FixJ family response regulator